MNNGNDEILREKNLFTYFLFYIGIAYVLVSIFLIFHLRHWNAVLLSIILSICLESFPIRLPSRFYLVITAAPCIILFKYGIIDAYISAALSYTYTVIIVVFRYKVYRPFRIFISYAQYFLSSLISFTCFYHFFHERINNALITVFIVVALNEIMSAISKYLIQISVHGNNPFSKANRNEQLITLATNIPVSIAVYNIISSYTTFGYIKAIIVTSILTIAVCFFSERLYVQIIRNDNLKSSFDSFYDSLPLPIVTINNKGEIKAYNNNFVKFARKYSIVITNEIYSIFPEIHYEVLVSMISKSYLGKCISDTIALGSTRLHLELIPEIADKKIIGIHILINNIETEV